MTDEQGRVPAMSDHAALVAKLGRLAKEATNGWACYAKRDVEHTDIARLHREIADALAALAPTPPPADLDYAPYWVVALRACDEALDKHSLWCGHKKDSPGDPSINRAERLIRSALRRADAEAAAPPPAEAAPEPMPAGRETMSDEHAADIIQLVREKQQAIREAQREVLAQVRAAIATAKTGLYGEVSGIQALHIIDAKLAALRGGQP